ncbi:MAG: VWD domain-containing protein [Crocinitomicaceae bacterium]
MRSITTLILVSTAVFSFGQEKITAGFEPIRKELHQWDVIRGPWLANSIEAIANDQPIPPRTFPENFTPNQMLRMVDQNTRNNIRNTSNENRTNSQNAEFWNRVNRTVESAYCAPKQARTYGDPHMVSFDGARYSFQTVGEFVLTKSSRGDVEVQTRQKPQSDDFSLNTAVAMNVGGDRLAIYAEDYPDADYSTPVRLNGQSLRLNGSTYFLDHGGTVQKSGQSYFVHWPNGESAEVKMRSSGGMSFMDVSVNILPCVVSSYEGVLGNANGIERDDFDPGIIVPRSGFEDPFDDDNYVNRERQAYISKVIADRYRVTDFTTLFDYPIGRNTESYTDRSFPRVYRSINDLDQRNRDRARQRCEQNGISSRDMNGCIYDNAFLNLEPVKEPRVNDPVASTPTLRKIDREVINRNPDPTNGVRGSENLNQGNASGDTQPQPVPIRTDPVNTKTDGSDDSVSPAPSEPTPVYKPRPVIRESEPRTPTPKPVPIKNKPTSSPIPKTSPTPSATPKSNSGGSIKGRGGF